MKGILMAGGKGSRLFPSTEVINKHLVPVFDKPMIYYSLSIFLIANIKEIYLICNKEDKKMLFDLLGDGSKFGINISYGVQERPNGIAEAFILAKDFIGKDKVCLVLGDNIFYCKEIESFLTKCVNLQEGAVVFGKNVDHPERFGVIEYDIDYNAISITEKPENPKSNTVIPGIYFFDNNVVEIAKQISPSTRGELEIPSILNVYLVSGKLRVEKLNDDIVWVDAGTPESLYEAIVAIQKTEYEEGRKIACIEEISYEKRYISKDKLEELISSYPSCEYKNYLKEKLKNDN